MQEQTDKNLQLNAILGKTIKKFRVENKIISLNQLANQYEISKSAISKIENGNVDCKFSTLWKITEALGIKFSDFAKALEDELGEEFTLIDE